MTLALVFVNCDPEKSSGTEKRVRQLRGVIESHSTSGAYDMILKVTAKSEAELRDVIKSVTKVSGIASILTSIVYSGK